MDHRTRHVPPDIWIDEFKVNYTTVVSEMKRKLRPGVDCLVLQTVHAVRGLAHTYSLMINVAVKEVAKELDLPLFPVDEVVRNCPAEVLLDNMHLSKAANAVVSEALLRYINVYHICDSNTVQR